MNLRTQDPGLYYSIVTLSLTSVALAVNFWTSNPTFNPYGISKNLIGVVFATLGAVQIVFLLLHDWRKVRIVMTVSVAFIIFWGVTNTQQFFAGNASLQLPILYLAVAVLHLPMIVELLWREQL